MPKVDNYGSSAAISGTPSSVVNDMAPNPIKDPGQRVGAWLPGVLSFIGSLGSSIFQNIGTRKNMDYQAQLNLEQWNRENAYNSPAAQMARFAGAGLNPDLIYGQSNTSGTGNISTEAPSGSKPDFGSSVQQALNFEMMRSQIDLNESAAARNYADADIKPDLGQYYQSGSRRNDAQANLFAEEVETQIQAQAKYMAEVRNLDARTAKQAIENENLQDWYDHEFALMESELEKNDVEIQQIQAKIKVMLEKLPYEIEAIQASANKDNALASYYARVRETLYDEIWNSLAYKSGVSFDENGSAGFATNGAKWMSTATQGAERGSKIIKDLVSAVMNVVNGVKNPLGGLVHETWSKTTGPDGVHTTHAAERYTKRATL